MIFSMRLWRRKRDGIYQAVFDNGQQKSLHTRDYAEALRLYAPIRKQWLDGKLQPLTGECHVTLGQYKKEYLPWAEDALESRSTFRANRLALDKLVQYAGKGCRLDRIGVRHIDQMIAESKKAGLSVSSINNYIRHARAALNKAVEWKYVVKNPLAEVRELKAKKGPPRFMARIQAVEFLRTIDDLEVRRFATAAIATGRRRSELFYLRWEDIDLERGRYFVRKTKGQSFWAPINGVFRAVLLSFGLSKQGRVFVLCDHPDTISHKIKTALVNAGYPGLTLHSLRHTFASLKAMDGASLRQIQALLGHKDIKATQIYAHLTDDHLAEIAEINLGPVDLGK